jgi:hypothetical protein
VRRGLFGAPGAWERCALASPGRRSHAVSQPHRLDVMAAGGSRTCTACGATGAVGSSPGDALGGAQEVADAWRHCALAAFVRPGRPAPQPHRQAEGGTP